MMESRGSELLWGGEGVRRERGGRDRRKESNVGKGKTDREGWQRKQREKAKIFISFVTKGNLSLPHIRAHQHEYSAHSVIPTLHIFFDEIRERLRGTEKREVDRKMRAKR